MFKYTSFYIVSAALEIVIYDLDACYKMRNRKMSEDNEPTERSR